ncbi:hypothetical protein GCM10007906_35470 [Vibrio hyugaensis]|uniref:Uncharacterized protein n=1 Tax=Vibrio hyugaensis TaxID=1534743 RepID=A0ABQ5Y7D7_9VIBR|nr:MULTISPECIES: hypothetical protein [Vibrio]MBE3762607.1 hypothetical protein [Vibrio parahaemolyticus]TOA86565.1 hypothetical protein CGK17_22665 [Vibrio parahaemolyticus]TOG25096.1 hypothetical protein CGJ06_04580 [Vibrio parahaemolyticus]GLR05959.1 hypothetical protein GCM10007906_35470 [Vibrio hyugaensis]HCE1988596.1 hypothetical protein [Vibrio parahaemolyticus]
MKFLGKFKQIFEAHEVKPHLRDIAMFVTLNNTRLYPREQFDENGDIHPYLAPRLDLIKIIKQENSVKWFFTERTYQIWDYKVPVRRPAFLKARMKQYMKAEKLFEQSRNYVTASPASLLRRDDEAKVFNMFCDYMLTFNQIAVESKSITLNEWLVWFSDIRRIEAQKEENKEKQRRHREVIAECNKLEDDQDSTDEN